MKTQNPLTSINVTKETREELKQIREFRFHSLDAVTSQLTVNNKTLSLKEKN
jgi:hypothetical protein